MPRRRKYSYYGFDFEPTRPIEVEDGIKARSQRGAFAQNWWATRWIHALERLVDPGRLRRGRRYARQGQVLSIEETEDSRSAAGRTGTLGIFARVQGSRRSPYKVTIQVAPLSEAQWEQVIGALSEQALFTAQLLAGEMPPEVEQAFQAAGVSLFPERRGDLETDCSCPDWSNPCKHIAAVHYILGERFDEDPFLLFRLRGRTQEQVLQALRRRRVAVSQDSFMEEEVEAEVAVPLEETLERFYEPGAPLEGFSVELRAPAVELPLLKRLGEAAFVPAPGILALLRPVYQEITRAVLEAAFQEEEGEGDGGTPGQRNSKRQSSRGEEGSA